MKLNLWKAILCLGLFLSLMALPVHAQPADGGGNGGGNGGNGGNGNGGGGGRNWDPAAMRQRMEERMKEQLDVTDDEWAAIQPKLEKVFTLQMAQRIGGGRRGGFGGPGRNGQDGGAQPAASTQPASPLAQAQRDLQTVLNNKESGPDQIKEKLAALRDAKIKSKDELTKAQADLRELLTLRQEAVLVSTGMLD